MLTHEVCQNSWSHEIDRKVHFCTDLKLAGTESGDSGGPVVLNGKIVGITSSGDDKNHVNPDIFTNVSKFYDWILKHIQE